MRSVTGISKQNKLFVSLFTVQLVICGSLYILFNLFVSMDDWFDSVAAAGKLDLVYIS